MAASDVYRSASTITPGTPVIPGDGIGVACESAGYLNLMMQDGSIFPIYAQGGATGLFDNLAVRDVVTAGSTAVAKVTVLRKG